MQAIDLGRFFVALKDAEVPDDFLDADERQQGVQERDPVAGWTE